jgi:hypothetical protein
LERLMNTTSSDLQLGRPPVLAFGTPRLLGGLPLRPPRVHPTAHGPGPRAFARPGLHRGQRLRCGGQLRRLVSGLACRVQGGQRMRAVYRAVQMWYRVVARLEPPFTVHRSPFTVHCSVLNREAHLSPKAKVFFGGGGTPSRAPPPHTPRPLHTASALHRWCRQPQSLR